MQLDKFGNWVVRPVQRASQFNFWTSLWCIWSRALACRGSTAGIGTSLNDGWVADKIMANWKQALLTRPWMQGALAVSLLGSGILHYLAISQGLKAGEPAAVQAPASEGCTATAQLGGKQGNQAAGATAPMLKATTKAEDKAQGNAKGNAKSQAKGDAFRLGVNAAQQAAIAAQTARTPQQWAVVAEHWRTATQQMRAVPSTHPRAMVAQQKAKEYQQNQQIAQKRGQGALVAGAGGAKPGQGTGVVASGANSKSTGKQPTDAKLAIAAVPSTVGPTEAGGLLRPEVLVLGAVGVLALIAFEPRLLRRKRQPVRQGRLPGALSQAWQRLIRRAQGSSQDAGALGGPAVQWDLSLATPANAPKASQAHDEEMSTQSGLLSAPIPTRKVQRKFYRRLLQLTHDESAAIRVLKEYLTKYPDRSADWCCEKAICDLERENTM